VDKNVNKTFADRSMYQFQKWAACSSPLF